MTEQRHLTWVAAVAVLLTSLSLTPMFQEQPWVLPAIVVIALIAVVGYACRSLGLPPAAVAPLQLVSAALFVLYQFTPIETLWYALPTWDTVLALNDVGLAGRDVISRFATPVPIEGDGVVMLTVVGVAVATVVVDLLAVGLRQVPLAGLPLLALYTVPVAVVPDGVPWLFFALAAAAFVGLLVAEGRERLAHWGRTMGFSERETAAHQFVGDVQTGPIARVGRRIGAAAVCLAVAVPVVVPGLEEGLFGNGLQSGGSGGRTVMTSDPIVDLNRDLRRSEEVELFRYDTADTNPDYWRSVTLDVFTGSEWQRADDRNIPDENVATESMPPPVGVSPAVGSEPRTTDVEVASIFESRWLPLPYPVTSLATDGRWVYDADTRNVFGVERDTRGLAYSVESLELDYSAVAPGMVVPGTIEEYLTLPELPPELALLAQEVSAEATTPYEQAVALQAWFRDPDEFVYTLEAPEGHSTDNLLAFLEQREGYCEQFAATMALMARHLGIPARVNIGFTPGSNVDGTTWSVSSYDAHAWPELYFAELGWVRFEPTPAARTGTAPDWTIAPSEPAPAETEGATPGASDGPTTAPTGGLLEDGGAVDDADAGGSFRFPTIPALITLGVLLLLATPLLVRMAMTRTRWRRATTPSERVLAGWDVLRDRAADLGYDWPPSDTPRSLAARLHTTAGLQGDPADALGRLAIATERARYARDLGTPPSGDRVRDDVDTVATALADAVPRSRQLRARFVPGSTRRVVHAISESVADALDWVEGLGETARGTLRRRTAR